MKGNNKNPHQQNSQSALAGLTIRTMQHDLEIAEQEAKQRGYKAEAKVPLKEEVAKEESSAAAAQLLKESLAAFKKNDYQKAIASSEKIILDKKTSRLIRRKAKNLIKKCLRAQGEIEREKQKRLKQDRKERLTAEKAEKARMKEQAAPAQEEKEMIELMPDYLPIVQEPVPAKQEPVGQPFVVEPEEKQEPAALAPEPAQPSPPQMIPPQEKEPSPAPIVEIQQPEEVFRPAATPSVPSRLGLIPEEAEAKPTTTSLKKLGLIAGSLALMIAVFLGYILWPKPKEPSEQIEEQVAPTALFYMEQEKIVEMEQSDLSSLPQRIQSLAEEIQESQTPGEFVHLILKYSGEEKYFSAFEALDGLSLASIKLDCSQATSTPCQKNSMLIDNINDEYSLFLYSNKEAELSTSTVSTSSMSVRLGLIIKLKDSARVKEILVSAEPELVEIFSSVLLDEKMAPESDEFKENIYNDVVIKYINLPQRLLSVDYAVYNDYLLFATSKESALTALDRIIQD